MDEPIDYAAVLADLKARRVKLDAAIEAVSAIMGAAPPSENRNSESLSDAANRPLGSTPTRAVAGDAFFGMSIADAAIKYLRAVKGPRSLKEIGDALNQGGLMHSSTNFSATLHTTLARRERSVADVVRVNRKWGLSEWYPGLKKRRPEEPSQSEPGVAAIG